MSVLTLRLAGPLQSWGASARFVRRTTESAPTKSGVIGLLAAAAGIERGDDTGLARLAALRFGVRIDQPGTRVRDFQTAHHPETGRSVPLSERYYLADAVFVAAMESSDTRLVDELWTAVRNPVFPPFLGRRSCPPAGPVELGLHEDSSLEAALQAEPWQAAPWYRRRHSDRGVDLTILREPRADEAVGGADTLRDQPLSFSAAHRRHALRAVVGDRIRLAPDAPLDASLPPHDPFEALGVEEEST